MTQDEQKEREALLPCPFCGSQADYVVHVLNGKTHHHGVSCTECTTELAWQDSKAEAIAAWNTRAAPIQPDKAEMAEPPALLAAVLAEIDRLGVMTADQQRAQQDVGFYELLDMAITMRKALAALPQRDDNGQVEELVEALDDLTAAIKMKGYGDSKPAKTTAVMRALPKAEAVLAKFKGTVGDE